MLGRWRDSVKTYFVLMHGVALFRAASPVSPESVGTPRLPPQVSVEPPTPAAVVERPFKDYPEDDEQRDGDKTPHDMLFEQQLMMDGTSIPPAKTE